MTSTKAYAASEAGAKFEPFTHDMADIGPEEVTIKVHYCGLCHSDLSMWKNHWGMTQYPFVGGHEVVGEVTALGKQVSNLKIGDKVGLGWFSASCMSCDQCMSGSHNLCPSVESTIVGRYGGFADHVSCHWSWATPLPNGIDMSKAGPLLCGGITVFNPILMAGVKPTDKVGVIGIGGLGHMAVKFLKNWGCEVYAFSSSVDKKQEILEMGAHHVINSKDTSELEGVKGTLDFVLNTTNVSLNWPSYLETLAPKGTLHTVGAVLEPMAIPAFGLIGGEKSVSGSPLGSPALTRKMLEFCVRHNIYPTTENYPMSQINEAFEHLESGKARYRIVLDVS